jgi:predicted RNA-binding protein with PUA-like domain
VPLERLRGETALADMQILKRGNRLSITPLTEAEFKAIRALGAAVSGASEGIRAKSGARGKASR